jgi:hypothetical protein
MVAFAELPVLPGLPLVIDPDRWVRECDGQRFVRKVDFRGTIKIDKRHYYINREMVGKYVMVEIDGESRQLVVRANKTSLSLKEIKRLPIKGLYNQEMVFEDYLQVLMKEARSERRLAIFKAKSKMAELAA